MWSTYRVPVRWSPDGGVTWYATLTWNDGSTMLYRFCRRCADPTPVQLALLVAAHPAQRIAIDGRGRTPLHFLVSFATDLTPAALTPLPGDGGAVTVADVDGRTPLHAAFADRAAVRPDALAMLVAAHPAAREQRDAACVTPLEYALAREVALDPASMAMLTPSGGGGGAAAARLSAPRITAVKARGSEVWLSLSPPDGGYADGDGARMLWYEIETIPLAPARARDGGASRPDVPARTTLRQNSGIAETSMQRLN